MDLLRRFAAVFAGSNRGVVTKGRRYSCATPQLCPVAFVVVARRGHPTVHFLPLIQLPLPDLQGASVRRLRVAR